MIFIPAFTLSGIYLDRGRIWIAIAGVAFLGFQIALMVKGAKEMKQEFDLSIRDQGLVLNGKEIFPQQVAKVRLHRKQLFIILNEGSLSDRNYRIKADAERQAADIEAVMRDFCRKHRIAFEPLR